MCDPSLDAAVGAAIGTYAAATVRSDVAGIERRIVADAAVVPLSQVRWLALLGESLDGFAPTPVTPYAGVWRWTRPAHAP